MFGTDIMIELRMFGFTNIPELVSPPPPSILKTPEWCKDKRQKLCFRISVFLFQISKMCLQLNILDSILTVGLQHFSGAQAQLFGAQLSGARLSGPDYPGPIIRGPICLEPAPMFCTNIRME